MILRPRLNQASPARLTLLTLLLLSMALAPRAAAQAFFTVNTTDDADDGSCDAVHCSLREAITAANQAVDGGIIHFNIPGAGPHTIQPLSALPSLGGKVIIDGTSEPDFAGTPIIELDGSLAGNAHGLDIVGSENLIRGLVINRFAWNGISVNTGCTFTVIEGNYIGTDVTGTLARGNGVGVLIGQAQKNTVGGTAAGSGNLISGNQEGVTIVDATATENVVIGNRIGTDAAGTAAVPNNIGVLLLAPDNRIGGLTQESRNVISGNHSNGIDLGPPNATGNTILGNFIGVDATGTAALGNDVGVFVNDVADNVIGGAAPGAGNVLSGNREGVALWDDGATGNKVQGNLVGTNAAGNEAVPNEVGIVIYGPENTIGGSEEGAGNLVSGNQSNGVNVFGEFAYGNTIQGNLVGTDGTGTLALGNGDTGVAIIQAQGNTIGGSASGAGNVLSGNVFGILIHDAQSADNRILGNYIGTDVTGTVAVPNAQTGILLWGQNTVIGGAEAGAGNVISGNAFAGIDLGGGSGGSTIQGNYIGTDATGTAALGNDLGIFVNFSSDNTIGGTAAGARNVISGNAGGSVTVNGIDATGNLLQGNYIGTDITGMVDLSDQRGIQILGAPDNTIGGTAAGAGDLISGNLNGVLLIGEDARGTMIQGNRFGTDATGSPTLGNRGATIRFSEGAKNNTVGGTASGAGNTITGSGWMGVILLADAGTGNRVHGNSIFDNGALGLELGRDGVSANDEGDPDSGPNNFQNYPTLTSVVSGGGAVIQADLNSAPSSTFTVDFFSSATCDPTGYGEGQTPLGTATLTTDASGNGTATAAFSSITGTVLTATATDSNGNTSEFSACGDLTTLAVASSPTTRTVLQGQSTTYAITVSAQGGTFDETLSLSCSGAPSRTTCTFDQDQVTLVAGQASATMTVITTAPAGSGLALPRWRSPGPTAWPAIGLLLLSALAFLPPTRRRSRPGPGCVPPAPVLPPFLRLGALTIAGGLIVLLQISCGGDGSSPPTGGTPTGTYELTVTATWESAQTTSTATLVVQ